MQVKPIFAPGEAERSEFGNRFFLADSREVASVTHTEDLVAVAAQGRDMQQEDSAWIAVPFGREFLVAAGMTALCEGSVLEDIAEDITDIDLDWFREWVVSLFLSIGASRVAATLASEQFQRGYAGHPVMAECFVVISDAVDHAFGFGTAPDPARVPAPRPARQAGAVLAGVRDHQKVHCV